MQRKAIIIGATGLVGQYLVKQLSEIYDTVIVVARRPLRYINASIHFYQVNDFDNLMEICTNVSVDQNTDAFSCLGTTRKLAGSDEAFRKVDHDYNVNFAALCREKGVENFFLLSAMNNDINSRFLYNRVKAETEQSIVDLDFKQLYIFRPSLLLGKHKGRKLENMSQNVFKILSPIVPESLSIHPISARRVASAMTMTANALYERRRYQTVNPLNTTSIIENKQMLAMTRVKH